MKATIRRILYFKLGGALLALLAISKLNAQQPAPTQTFTLEESIAFALKHNVQVKNERLNLGIAKAQIGETTAQGLPQINGSVNYTNNLTVQQQFLPDFISPAVYGVLEQENLVASDPNRQFGIFGAAFGTPHTANASLSVSQLIFNGSYFVGLRAAKVFRELTEKNLQKAEIDVAEGVALAYYGALVAEERLRLLEANVDRLDSVLVETQALYEAGFAEEIGVKRIRVNLNNLKTEYENVQRALAINLSALKFQMGIPMEEEIAVAGDLRSFDIDRELLLPQDFTYSDRIEYKQLQVNKELAELDVKNNKVQYYPTITAFGNFGYNAGKPNFQDLFEETPDTERTNDEGTTEIIEQNTWNDFASIGVTMNIPIFDGLAKANRIRRTKLVVEQVQNQLDNLENAIDLELEQARINLENNLQSLKMQEENMQLAQEVAQVARIKYQEGVGSSLEVVEAENQFKAAESNYYNALYNALVARVNFQKASGTLLTNP